jgi:hypothetical protein
MRTICFLMCLCILSCKASAQLSELSDKSIRKLKAITSPKKKLLAYHKLYKRDSIRFDRDQLRKLRKAVDSTYCALNQKYLHQRVLMPDTMSIGQARHVANAAASMINDSIDDLSGNDLANGLQQRVDGFLPSLRILPDWREADIRKAELPNADLPGHTLSRTDLVRVSGIFGDAERMTSVEQNISPSANPPTLIIPDNKDTLNFISLKTVLSRAERYLSQLPERNKALTGAKEKVARLSWRYKSFTASNDEIDGVKQRSLKGFPLLERIFVANDLNFSSLSPFIMSFAPQLGFKLNRNWVTGFTTTYRLQISDSVDTSSSPLLSNAGIGLFTSLVAWKSFFLHAEWNRLRQGQNDPVEANNRVRDYGFVGIGKKMLVHPKILLVTKALYSLGSGHNKRLDLSRVQLRVGIQLSELAIRKSKPTFDPNRW